MAYAMAIRMEPMAMDFLLTTYSGFREYPNPNWSIVMQAPEKNLAFDLVRVTESAALSAARWLGKGDKEAGDGAAVDAIRLSFNSLGLDGVVIIGKR